MECSIEIDLEFCQLQQLPKIMRVAVIYELLLREVELLSSLCNTRLDSTLNCIPGEVVCAVGKTGLKKGSRFTKPDIGELLQISPIH